MDLRRPPTWISGWFLSKTGAVFSDIRAVIDGVPYLGVLGMPASPRTGPPRSLPVARAASFSR